MEDNNNNNNNNKNNEILFWKVIHNKFLFNLIFEILDNQDLVYSDNLSKNHIGNRIKFKEINSLQWMVQNNQYSLLVDKLKSNQFIDIDTHQIRILFDNCKDQEILSLFLEKNTIIKNLSELLDISILSKNFIVFKLLIENSNNNNNNSNKSVLIKTAIQRGSIEILKYLISNLVLSKEDHQNLLQYNLLSLACDSFSNDKLKYLILENEYFQSIIFNQDKIKNFNSISYNQLANIQLFEIKKKLLNFNYGSLILCHNRKIPHFKEIVEKMFDKNEDNIEKLLFHFKELFNYSVLFKNSIPIGSSGGGGLVSWSVPEHLKDIKEIRKQFTIMNILSTFNSFENVSKFVYFHELAVEDNSLYHYLYLYDDFNGLEKVLEKYHLFIVYQYAISLCSLNALKFLVDRDYFIKELYLTQPQSPYSSSKSKLELPIKVSFIDSKGSKYEIIKNQKRVIQFLEFYFENKSNNLLGKMEINIQEIMKIVIEHFNDENFKLIESLFIKYNSLVTSGGPHSMFTWSSKSIDTKILTINRYIWLLEKEIKNEPLKVVSKVNLNLPYPIDDDLSLINFIIKNKIYFKPVFKNKNFIFKFTNLESAIYFKENLNIDDLDQSIIKNNLFSNLFQISIFSKFNLKTIKWIDNNLNFKFFIKNLSESDVVVESTESTSELKVEVSIDINEKIEIIQYLIETEFISIKEECIPYFILYHLKFIIENSIQLLNLKIDYLVKILSILLLKQQTSIQLIKKIEFILNQISLKQTIVTNTLNSSYILKSVNIPSLLKIFENGAVAGDEKESSSIIIIDTIKLLLSKKELLFKIYSNQSNQILFSFHYRMLINSKNITISEIESVNQLLSNGLIEIIGDGGRGDFFTTNNLYNYFYHLKIKDIRLTPILEHIVKNHLFSIPSKLLMNNAQKEIYFSKLDIKLKYDNFDMQDNVIPEIYDILMFNKLTLKQIVVASNFDEIVLSLVNQILQVSKTPINDTDSILRILINSTSNIPIIIKVLNMKSIYKQQQRLSLFDSNNITILNYLREHQFKSFIEIYNPNHLYELLINSIYNSKLDLIDYLLKNYSIPFKNNVNRTLSNTKSTFSKPFHFKIFKYLYDNNILTIIRNGVKIVSTTTTITTTATDTTNNDCIKEDNKFILPVCYPYAYVQNTISIHQLFADQHMEIIKFIENIN